MIFSRIWQTFHNDKRRLKKIVEGFANSKFFEYLPPIAKDKKNILVLGHSYVIFDNNLNKGILQIIKDSGYNPIYPYTITFQTKRLQLSYKNLSFGQLLKTFMNIFTGLRKI